MPYTVQQILIFLIVALCVTLLSLIAIVIAKKRNINVPKPLSILISTLCVLAAGACCAFAVTCAIASTKGMYTLETSAERFIPSIIAAHTDESDQFAQACGYDKNEILQPIPNTILSIYRFGCPDCEDLHEDLTAMLNDSQIPHWWISSRSKIGREICDTYGVTQVPCIISFDSEGRASVADITQRDVGKTVLDEKAVEIAENHARK